MPNPYTDAFIMRLPPANFLALKEVTDAFFSEFEGFSDSDFLGDLHDDIVDCYGFLTCFVEARNIRAELEDLPASRSQAIELIFKKFRILGAEADAQSRVLTLERAKQHYSLKLSQDFSYHLSEGDIERIKGLISRLRELIQTNDDFPLDYKTRLLRRLSALESELNTRMTNFDKFYGLFVETSVIVQKFNKVAKPYVELITTISKLAWNSQARAEALPSDSNLTLPASTEENG